MDDSLQFDPKDYYEKDVKSRLEENATKYIDNLIQKSGINLEENKLKVQEIEKSKVIDQANEKRLSKYVLLKTICVILSIASIIGFVIGILFLVTKGNFEGESIYNTVLIGGIVLIVASLVIGITCTVLIFTKLNKIIKKLKEQDEANNATIDSLINEAKRSISSLINSFDFYDFNNIIKETSNIFELDDYLDYEKLALMRLGYGLKTEPTEDESIVAVTSGSVKTNPFIRLKVFEKINSTKTYVGTKVITWTERVSDGKDGTRLVTRSQTLTATVTKFYPAYANASYTIYGNEAAPNLEFSRQPSGLGVAPSEKDIEKYVDKYEKKLDKLSAKSISKGGNLTFMANSKFETLFGAINRTNETQYRLLFTPLAQQNMCEIITQNPYGDDFTFFKRNKINIISSLHGRQVFEFNEHMFDEEYDVSLIRTNFIKVICEIYKSIYYELAPILAIPLYQTTEGGKYDIKRELAQQISDFEAEAFANSMDLNNFKPQGSSTPQIIKTKYVDTIDNMDIYDVHSNSYKTMNRVDYVSVPGGDGRIHSVPVHWVEYLPVSKTSRISVKEVKNDVSKLSETLQNEKVVSSFKTNFTSPNYHKRFFGFVIKNGKDYKESFNKDFNDCMNKLK